MRNLLFLFLLTASLLLCEPPCCAGAPPAAGLDAALKAALSRNPAIKGKLAELESQGYVIETTKSNRYPSLSAQLSTQDDGSDQTSLRIRQPLWAFGKIDTPIAQAKAEYLAEQMSLLQVQRQLMEQTAVAYAKVEGAEQRLLVADENIAEHQKLHDRIERRQAGQLASAADVRIAYSRLLQAQAQRERIVGELQVARDELLTLCQVEIGTEIPVDAALVQLPARARVESLAVARSADILQKQSLIKVAEYGVKQEKIASTPTLFLQAERGFTNASEEDETRVGLLFEGSLEGAGLGIVSRVRSASSRVDAAWHDLRSTRNDVELRISNLLTNQLLQSALKRSQQASVEAVEETMASFLRQYETGRKTWLEVLNIQRELTEQRLQLAQARSDWLTFSLRIAALIGQLDDAAGLQPVEQS